MEFISSFFKLVRLIYRLSRETHRFVESARGDLEHEDADQEALLRQTYRRIVRIAACVFVFGCVIIPCVTPWVAVWLHGYKPLDGVFRMVMGLLISFGAACLYLFAGVALGCLTAPAEFFRSRAGAQWMALMGTRSVLVSRITCVLGVLVGCAIMVWEVDAILRMAPGVR
jgi:hypothetical protein